MGERLAKLIVVDKQNKKSSKRSARPKPTGKVNMRKGKIKNNSSSRLFPQTSSFMDFLFSKTKVFNEFKEMSSFVTSILKASNYPFFVVDNVMNIQYMNPACLEFTGVNLKDAMGQVKCKDVFSSNLCETSCAIQQAIASKKPVVGKKVIVKDKNEKEHAIIVSAGPLMDAKGKILGGFEMWRDAMPDEEERYRVDKLLGTLKNYCGEMDEFFDSLEQKKDSENMREIKSREKLMKNMRRRTRNLFNCCNNILNSACWDILDCPPERQVQCPAFPNNGRNCWEIDYTWCDGQMQGKASDKTKECKKCPVHKSLNESVL